MFAGLCPVFPVCTGHLQPHRTSHNLLHRLWMHQRLSQARRLSVILVTLIFSSPLVDSSLTLLDADSLGLALSFRPAAYTFSRIARTLAASFVKASSPSQTCRILVYFKYQAIDSFSVKLSQSWLSLFLCFCRIVPRTTCCIV